MTGKTAVLIGATGLIGSHLLRLLENDPEFSQIRVLLRRKVTFSNPKVQAAIIDFSDLSAFRTELIGCDGVFCTVGTTNKKMKGNQTEYRKIDYDIPVNAARLCSEAGCRQFAVVSSLGANSMSRNFYLRLKGEVENALAALNISSLHVFRPSFLVGKRNEFRLGELLAKIFTMPVSIFMPANIRPIQAKSVARAMLQASKSASTGIHIYHSKEMRQLAKMSEQSISDKSL